MNNKEHELDYYYIGFSEKVMDFYADIKFPSDFSDRFSYSNKNGNFMVVPTLDPYIEVGELDGLDALVQSTDFCVSENIKSKLESFNLNKIEFYPIKFEYSNSQFYYIHVYNMPEFVDLDGCEYEDEDYREYFPGIYEKIAIIEENVLSIPLNKRLVIKEPVSRRILFHKEIVDKLNDLNIKDIGFYSIKNSYCRDEIEID